MKNAHPLLHEIEAFLGETQMSASYFGKRAVGNSELVARLRDGGDVTLRTAERVRLFMAESPAGSAPSREAS